MSYSTQEGRPQEESSYKLTLISSKRLLALHQTTKFEVREYDEIDFPMDFAPKLKKVNKNSVAITLDEAGGEAGNPEFTMDFVPESQRYLWCQDQAVHQEVGRDQERARRAQEIGGAQDPGMSASEFKDLYPGFASLSVYLVDLQNLPFFCWQSEVRPSQKRMCVSICWTP